MADGLRDLTELDRLIHEPARLLIVTILSTVESADFLFLQRETGLTKGNLSAHLSKLEKAGYVEIEKTFKGKLPLTVCKLNSAGRKAFKSYCRKMERFLERSRS
jgi:DNA-binding transcriptional ArsR family regulator